MFCYTSGTTGDAKGAKVLHKCILAAASVHDYGELNFGIGSVSLSYLPYAHCFEQCVFMQSLAHGLAHGYYSGDPLKVLDDIQTLKPTFFPTVPRVLNKLYAKIMESVEHSGTLKQWLFERAVDSKTYYLKTQGEFKHGLYDKLVFKKITQLLGGNLQSILTASAPISGEVLTFFKVALGIHIFEVYGQTETLGPASLTLKQDPTAGHVGGIFPAMKIRLKDVAEMGYLSTDNPPRGEIQFYGSNLFNGYFKNPEKTKETIDEEGWVTSGDVGIIYPNGSLKLIDRAKNIFKLC